MRFFNTILTSNLALMLLFSVPFFGCGNDDSGTTSDSADVGNVETDADPETDTETDTNSETDTEVETDADPETDTEVDTEPEPDTNTGSVEAYGACQSNEECTEGFVCHEAVREAEFGQCVRTCSDNSVCEDGGTGTSAVCRDGFCRAQCGDNGTCPEGLECHDISDCLEPSTAQTGPAGSCATGAECAEDTICISGESTQSHCAIQCSSNQDCLDVTAGGECKNFGGISICWFMCGSFGNGAECPGDLICDVAVCI